MKKKRRLLLLLPLLLLLIPFSVQRYRDGGTLDVRAIAWRYVGWRVFENEEIRTVPRFYLPPHTFFGINDLGRPDAPETEAEPQSSPETDDPADGATASLKEGHVNLRLTLPAGWKYGTERADEGSLNNGAAATSLTFFPENGAGRVRFGYQEFFGVCGTGLTTRELGAADGLRATVGYYDGSPDWSYVYFPDAPGCYAAYNEGLTGDDAQTALRILQSAKVGEGELARTDALRIAEDALSCRDDELSLWFDALTGDWIVRLYDKKGGKTTDAGTVTADGVWIAAWTKAVSYAYGSAGVSITMPDDWGYEVTPYDPAAFGFSVTLYAPHDGGRVTLSCGRYFEEWQADETTDTTLPDGGRLRLYLHSEPHAVYACEYPDAPGVYSAYLFLTDEKDREDALTILRHIRFTRGAVSAEDAKEAVRGRYDVSGTLKASFDVETGVWTLQERAGGKDGALLREFFVDQSLNVTQRQQAQ